MSILTNKNGLAGQRTNAVLVSTPFMFKTLSPSFSLNHADIDVALILHKICNTNGYIRYSCIHHIHQQMKLFFESPRSHAQIYESMAKFEEHGLVRVIHHDDGKQTFQLNHFQDDEGKLYRYIALNPIVFTKHFNKGLTLAARKLFLLTSVQQGEKPVLKRRLHGDEGLYRVLCKNQPNHIQSVVEELKGKNKAKTQFLSAGKLEKRRGRYEYIYTSIHHDLVPVINLGEQYRKPLIPQLTYPRKVTFINKVLKQMGMGELIEHMQIMIQLMKQLGFRVIRQVLRQIREFVDTYGHFPKDLATFIKKEIRISREKEILDLASESDIYKHISPGLTGESKNRRYFEFALAFSTYHTKTIRRMFRDSKELINKVYSKEHTVQLVDYVHDTMLHQTKGIWGIRKYALQQEIDPAYYEELELKAVELYTSRTIESVSEAITWMFKQLTTFAEDHPLPKVSQYGTYGHVENLILHSYESKY